MRFARTVPVGLLVLGTLVACTTFLIPGDAFAASCGGGGAFFGLPHWYDNLQTTGTQGACSVVLNKPEDVWVIVVNLVNILLRLVGIVAVVFVVIGGIRYILSQGQAGSASSPGGVVVAKNTIVRAIVGLVIAISASLILTYVSQQLGQSVKTDSQGKPVVSLLTERYDG